MPKAMIATIAAGGSHEVWNLGKVYFIQDGQGSIHTSLPLLSTQQPLCGCALLSKVLAVTRKKGSFTGMEC